MSGPMREERKVVTALFADVVGSTPACAARPSISSRTSGTPLREETTSPFSRAPSRIRAASGRPASA